MYYQGSYYLDYYMKGECTVNYDSLKLQTNDDNLVIHNYLPLKGVRTYKLRKEEYLSIPLGFERKDVSLGIVNPLVLSILPSDFITINGQRITNDTLRVELIHGLKGYRWLLSTQYHFAFTDNLDSILYVMDEDGTKVFDALCDAWGKQTVTLNSIGLHRGYTEHRR